MPQYIVTVKTLRGVKEFSFESKDASEARLQGTRSGKVLSVKKERNLGFSRGLTPAERQIFLQRLSAMLASRVGAGEALALIRDTFNGRIKTIAGTLLRKVESGNDLGEAMENIGPPDFPETTTALIRAGSRGGQSHSALQDAAAFELEMHQIKKSSGKGMWGAIGAFFLAGALTMASTLYIGPEMMKSDIMKMNADSIDTSLVDMVANFMMWSMGIMMIAFIFLLFLATAGRQLFPHFADALIMKIPYYKDLVLSRNNYTILYGLSVLIRSGVRIEEALRLAMESAPAGALRQDLKSAMEAVRRGRPWAMAMKTLHPTDKAALATSQDREQIARSLDALSRQYRELYAQRIAAFVPTLQLLAALFLSLAGLVLFGQAILPMLQVTQGML